MRRPRKILRFADEKISASAEGGVKILAAVFSIGFSGARGGKKNAAVKASRLRFLFAVVRAKGEKSARTAQTLYFFAAVW